MQRILQKPLSGYLQEEAVVFHRMAKGSDTRPKLVEAITKRLDELTEVREARIDSVKLLIEQERECKEKREKILTDQQSDDEETDMLTK